MCRFISFRIGIFSMLLVLEFDGHGHGFAAP
jgi:hypothetical protein